ncbi:MAG: hypothetical protein JWP57_553, partial [Spirosoma sp.]|nr:hypothetical protein [Spirosoma sp.]
VGIQTIFVPENWVSYHGAFPNPVD